MCIWEACMWSQGGDAQVMVPKKDCPALPALQSRVSVMIYIRQYFKTYIYLYVCVCTGTFWLSHWMWCSLYKPLTHQPPLKTTLMTLDSVFSLTWQCWVQSSSPTATLATLLWLDQAFKLICMCGLIGASVIQHLNSAPSKDNWNTQPQHSK